MTAKEFKIAPSILSADFSRLGDEIKAVEEAGADWIHVDVMDGMFVPNITIGPPVLEKIKKVTNLPLDVHLMIQAPERYLEDFVSAGANTLSVHAEATTHLQRTLCRIRELGAVPSVALNPATPLYHLDHVWNDLDMVLLMTVNPGFAGQKFIPEMMNKIRTLRKKSERMSPNIQIEVDGGISSENIGEALQAGADRFVAGSAIFSTSNYRETIEQMRKAAEKAR